VGVILVSLAEDQVAVVEVVQVVVEAV